MLALMALTAVTLILGLWLLPRQLGSLSGSELFLLLGTIGLWRYGWWATHLVRAQLYEHWKFPVLRAAANGVWDRGWRPDRIHVLMTTFREQRQTADAVVAALVREVRAIGRPATVWLGSAEAADERTIVQAFEQFGHDLDIDLRIIRQKQPGKRVALALLLRALAREGIASDEVVAIMDGDFILSPGALQRCLPLFAADPSLHALTTDEEARVIGPRWMQSWLSMRFAQRRIGMQSHALSGRVLTLTGRFSMFRARHITSESFIRLVEADRLHHWLWGSFRFLSGDDKSTWFALLQQGVKMLYVPDARGITVEVIEGNGRKRMVDNLRRWSGNVLRNGWRAIRLGPRRMPPFIWWCLVDQRIAIWTTLLGPMIAIAGTAAYGLSFLTAYVLYVLLTRLALAVVLFAYSPRIDFNYVWCLYLNQLVNAGVKLYVLWRLPQQRWANRGNQSTGMAVAGYAARFRFAMAAYLTLLSVATLAAIALTLTGLATPSAWAFTFLLGR